VHLVEVLPTINNIPSDIIRPHHATACAHTANGGKLNRTLKANDRWLILQLPVGVRVNFTGKARNVIGSSPEAAASFTVRKYYAHALPADALTSKLSIICDDLTGHSHAQGGLCSDI